MKFLEITESEYKNFWEKSEQKSFLSAPEITQLKNDGKVFFFGLKKEKKLIAAAMIRGTKRRFSKYDFYAPRGVLVDYKNKKELEFFMDKIKKVLKAYDGYVLRIEPNVKLIERDIDGEIVKGGWNNEEVVENLQKIGFLKAKYIEGVSQITWQFVLPVRDRTEESLLAQMKPNTRRRLRQAMELGIEIKELKRENLSEFYEVLSQTAKRKDFETRNFEYFEKMFDLFTPKNEIKFVSATINPKKCLERLEKLKEKTEKMEAKTIRERKDRADGLKSIDVRMEKVKTVFPELKNQEVVLASGMFMTMQPEILHFAGGNANDFLKLDGQYVLQWEMIRRALKEGYDRYNFYGIPENINMGSENFGVYEFKRGFSGVVEQLVGEFELPLSPMFYLMKILQKIKT